MEKFVFSIPIVVYGKALILFWLGSVFKVPCKIFSFNFFTWVLMPQFLLNNILSVIVNKQTKKKILDSLEISANLKVGTAEPQVISVG